MLLYLYLEKESKYCVIYWMTNNKNKFHVISICWFVQISDCYFNFSSIRILEIDAMYKKRVQQIPWCNLYSYKEM